MPSCGGESSYDISRTYFQPLQLQVEGATSLFVATDIMELDIRVEACINPIQAILSRVAGLE